MDKQRCDKPPFTMSQTKRILVDFDAGVSLVEEKEIPKIYLFKCSECGEIEERECLNADAAVASYEANSKCATCSEV